MSVLSLSAASSPSFAGDSAGRDALLVAGAARVSLTREVRGRAARARAGERASARQSRAPLTGDALRALATWKALG